MGCTASNSRLDPTEKFNFEASYRNKFMRLSKEHNQLVKYIEENLDRGNEVDNEQVNVLRYKIELLLTMLAMEDKSKEVIVSRMETLKWMLMSEGQSAQQLEELFSQYAAHSPSTIDLNYDIDIASAIEKTRVVFGVKRDEIVSAFLAEDGTLRLTLTRQEFVSALGPATQLPTKILQILALRFFDGAMVSTTEFLTFFGSTAAHRLIHAANHAITMTQEILAANLESQPLTSCLDLNTSKEWTAATVGSELLSATRLERTELSVSVTKLVLLWAYVKDALLAEFEGRRGENSRTISSEQFSSVLMLVCGEGATVREALSAVRLPVNEEVILKMSALNKNDIKILSEHFEFGGRVHFNQFYKHVEAKAAMLDRHMLRHAHSFEEAMQMLESQRKPVDVEAMDRNLHFPEALHSLTIPPNRSRPESPVVRVPSNGSKTFSRSRSVTSSPPRVDTRNSSLHGEGEHRSATLGRLPRHPSITTITSTRLPGRGDIDNSSVNRAGKSGRLDAAMPRIRRRSSSFGAAT